MRTIVLLLVLSLLCFSGCNNVTQQPKNPAHPDELCAPDAPGAPGVPGAPDGHVAPGAPDAPDASSAQPDRNNRQEQMEHIRMQKIAYMTEKLGLTVDESQAFWPVYNQYWELAMKLQHDEFSMYKGISKSESSSLSDVDAIVDIYEKHAELVRTWSKEFAKVIPESKVAKVFAAEESFKNYLIRKGPWRPKNPSK